MLTKCWLCAHGVRSVLGGACGGLPLITHTLPDQPHLLLSSLVAPLPAPPPAPPYTCQRIATPEARVEGQASDSSKMYLFQEFIAPLGPTYIPRRLCPEPVLSRSPKDLCSGLTQAWGCVKGHDATGLIRGVRAMGARKKTSRLDPRSGGSEGYGRPQSQGTPHSAKPPSCPTH